jgi:hypothetical protein
MARREVLGVVIACCGKQMTCTSLKSREPQREMWGGFMTSSQGNNNNAFE